MVRSEAVSRFRLKFLLQEFDLRGPEVLIGRSPECHITIEDPLVSRRHARIRIDDGVATLEDLGSRNGVALNGVRLQARHRLSDGDRIRLGTQELVFYQGGRSTARKARTTGFMTVCGACQRPFPEKSGQCPHCGSAARGEDTVTGLVVEPQRSWTFQLFGEVIDRALATGRAREAERVLRRAAKEVDERLAAGERLDFQQIETITSFAISLAELLDAPEWLHWALNVHRHEQAFPSDAVLRRLEQLGAGSSSDTVALLEEFVAWVERGEATLRPAPTTEQLARLRELAARAAAPPGG